MGRVHAWRFPTIILAVHAAEVLPVSLAKFDWLPVYRNGRFSSRYLQYILRLCIKLGKEALKTPPPCTDWCSAYFVITSVEGILAKVLWIPSDTKVEADVITYPA